MLLFKKQQQKTKQKKNTHTLILHRQFKIICEKWWFRMSTKHCNKIKWRHRNAIWSEIDMWNTEIKEEHYRTYKYLGINEANYINLLIIVLNC